MDTSRVAAAVPLSDDRFLVFLEDGRIVEGLAGEEGITWAETDDVVPHTSATDEDGYQARWR